jgi:hypothetical protein
MRVEDIIALVRPRRKVHGIAAALLPFEVNGRIAVKPFQKHLLSTHEAGLMNAVNMDTGYINYLTLEERLLILECSREVLAPGTFVAGAYIEGLEGDIVSLYRHQMDQIVAHGGIPIIFQTARDSRVKSPARRLSCIERYVVVTGRSSVWSSTEYSRLTVRFSMIRRCADLLKFPNSKD